MHCDICVEDNVSVDADAYCPMCKQHLCLACRIVHQRGRFTKTHELVTGEALSQATTSLPETEVSSPEDLEKCSAFIEKSQCPEHKGNDIEYMCETHDAPCCIQCKRFSHRNCQLETVSVLASKPKTVESNKAALRTLHDIHDELEELQCDNEAQIATYKGVMDDIANDTNEQCRNVDKIVNKWEMNLVKAAQESFQEKSKQMTEHSSMFSEMLIAISDKRSKLESAMKYSDEDVVIVASDARRSIKKIKDVIKDIEAEKISIDLKMNINERSRQLSECLEGMCSLMVTNYYHQPMPQRTFYGISPARNLSYKERKAEDIGKVYVASASDKGAPRITGIELLQNGLVVMCDMENKKLKVYDECFRFLNDKLVTSTPWRMCLTDVVGQVAFTLPRETCFQLANINSSGTIAVGKRIRHGIGGGHFINHYKDTFILDEISKSDYNICIVNRSGQIVKRVKLSNLPEPFMNGRYVYTCMDDNQRIMYITNEYGGCLGVSVENGVVLFHFMDKRRNGHNAYSGVTTDSDGNVYVGGLETGNVFQVGEDGKTSRELIRGVENVMYIKYVGFRNILFVKQDKECFLKLFQLA